MAIQRKVALTEDAAKRVAAATLAYERGNRDQPAISFRAAVDDGLPIRLCKTATAWNKGTTATLNVWESGSPGSVAATSGVTIPDCVNNIASLPAGVLVGLGLAANGAHYLVWFDMTALSGYSASAQQVLGHNTSGQLVWLNTTACT